MKNEEKCIKLFSRDQFYVNIEPDVIAQTQNIKYLIL